MADIFLSYSRKDKAFAALLVEYFEAAGFSVWWDVESIRVGDAFHQKIEKAITESKKVVVLWSEASQKSRWVRDEAEEALEQGKLIQVLINDIQRPPMGFRTFQALRINFRKAEADTQTQRLLQDLAAIIPKEKPNPAKQPEIITHKPAEQRIITPPKPQFEPLSTFHDKLKGGSQGPEMVVIPAGEFLMGSAEGEPKRRKAEGPQHRVTLPSFALGKTAVTFDEFDYFAKQTQRKPPYDEWGRGKQPVIYVSWHDAIAFCEWLALETGEQYRLPSEAEWEYACRAGTTTPFSTGNCINTGQANYNGRNDYADCGARTGVYREKTVEVGTLPDNPWGLHEMHGNVREWLADCWHENYKNAPTNGRAWLEDNAGDCSRGVVRGGSWYNIPEFLRSANRFRFGRDEADDNLGFRVARTL